VRLLQAREQVSHVTRPRQPDLLEEVIHVSRPNPAGLGSADGDARQDDRLIGNREPL
jgi:hypothetical protein